MAKFILITLLIVYVLPLVIMVLTNLVKRRFVLTRVDIFKWLSLKVALGFLIYAYKYEGAGTKWHIDISIGMIEFGIDLGK